MLQDFLCARGLKTGTVCGVQNEGFSAPRLLVKPNAGTSRCLAVRISLRLAATANAHTPVTMHCMASSEMVSAFANHLEWCALSRSSPGDCQKTKNAPTRYKVLRTKSVRLSCPVALLDLAKVSPLYFFEFVLRVSWLLATCRNVTEAANAKKSVREGCYQHFSPLNRSALYETT